MENFLSGGISELEQAKADIEASRAAKVQADETAKALKAKEKEVESQKKAMNDKIDSNVRSRRNEIEKTHDEVVHSTNKKLKEAEKNKKNAKQTAVDARVKEETAALKNEIKTLKQENKDLFKQWKIPGFCNTTYYYAMFAAKHAYEFVIFAITVIICIAIIPNIVCLLLKTSTTVKVFVYIGIVVVFLLIYFIIMVATRSGAKGKVIEKARPNRDKIREDKKQIKKLEKSIRKDSDEEQYGLGEYDAEIDSANKAANEALEQKNAALAQFDQETAVEIKSEIEKECLPAIENLEMEASALKEQLAAEEAEAQRLASEVTANYQSYLGEKNMTPERISSLIDIMKENPELSIMQAIEAQKAGKGVQKDTK